LTTLYIRHPAKAEVDGAPPGTMPVCQFALVADDASLVQQGAAALGSLGELVASARRAVLIVAASDVTLLRVKVPPLSAARLRAALPNLVEDQLLGDPAECVLVMAPAQGTDGVRTVAVVQRAWLEVLVKALLAQGAHSIAALPAQLCLPHQAGTVAAALDATSAGLELSLRLGQYEGMGLALAPDPGAALAALGALAGVAPVVLYLPQDRIDAYRALLDGTEAAGAIALAPQHWNHWVAGAKTAAPDLIAGLGASGTAARNWRRWRWPVRLALLALIVNLAGLNIAWWRMKREADTVRLGMLQTFKAAYPKETVILDPAAQMRKNIAAAKLTSGQVGADEFIYLSAALGEVARSLPRKPALTALEYRERALQVKFTPASVDAAATAQVKAALAARQLALSEPAPGVWQIRGAAAPAPARGAKP
jgi:general secretion pathway protein L